MKLTTCVRTRNPAAESGFTLIELMVTMAVAGILTAVALPAFNSFVLNDRDIGQINSLVSSFNYARSEAIKRDLQGGISVCPSVDGATCSGGTAWSGGWVVVDALGDPPLQVVPALGGSNTLKVAGSATGITFLSSGMVAPSALTTVTICDIRGGASAREVEINATGRVVASPTPGQTVAGAALTCP